MDRDITYDGQVFSNLYMTSFLQYLINKNIKISPAIIENGWLEVDTCKDLEVYHNLKEKGNIEHIFTIES
jgi:predicted class III extradiol MEMO1 family dioxygenase